MRLLRRRPLLGLSVVSIVATAIGIAISLAIDWFPTEGSTAAGKIDDLYDVLLIASVPVFVLVMSVAIYSVLAFRAKPGDLGDGEPIHGHTKLEVVWVTIPFLMVSALAVYGWVVLNDIEAKQPNELVVNVTGQQFNWSFDYPKEQRLKTTELVLPKGRQVEFRIRTKDVIHSFWVPEFRLKSDAPPGLTTKVRVTPSRVGRYEVVCAELCGIGHSTMRQTVRVVPPAKFGHWLAARHQEARREGALGEGRRLFTSVGCAGCHTLSDADSEAQTGPPLEGLGEIFQKREPGKSLKQYLHESIVDPKAFVVSGFSPNGMPGNYRKQLGDAQVDTLVDYLARTTGGGLRSSSGGDGETSSPGRSLRGR
jgi:cytochrome c oxidase subunit II